MIKCAIVGLGRIGYSLGKDPKREKPASHVQCILETEETILVCGCDIDEKKREEFKKEFNVPVYENIEEMFKKEKIDIIHIATPTQTHKDLVIKSIENKIPVIICEKPLSSNLREAKKILKKAKKSESKIVLNYERRYSKDYIYTKNIVESKKYGDIVSINSKLYIKTNSIRKALWHDATHLIDILMFLTHDNLKIKKIFNKDNIINIFFTSKNIPIYMEVSNSSDYLMFELDIIFQKGRIIIGNGVFKEYKSKESKFYSGFNSLSEKDVSFDKTEYFIGMFKDAVKAFKDKNYIPISNIKTGFENIKIMSKIVKNL